MFEKKARLLYKPFTVQYADMAQLLEKAAEGATLQGMQSLDLARARLSALKVSEAGATFLLFPKAAKMIAQDRGAPAVARLKQLVASRDLGGAITLFRQYASLAYAYVSFAPKLVRPLPQGAARTGRRNLKPSHGGASLHRCPLAAHLLH